MRKWQSSLILAIAGWCSLGATSTGPGTQMVDNFLYAAWAKFPVGASVTLHEHLEIQIAEINQTNALDTTSTYVLKAVTPERIELEVTQLITQNFRTRTMPKQMMTVPARVAKDQEMVSMKTEGARPIKQKVTNTTEKHEKLDIAGVRIDSTLHECTIAVEGSANKMKAWFLPEVPGGLVKIEARTEGTVQSTSKVNLIEFRPAPGVLGRLDLPPGRSSTPSTTAPRPTSSRTTTPSTAPGVNMPGR